MFLELQHTVEVQQKELSDIQYNPGWGGICAVCENTFPDEEKYIDFAPSLPCKKMKWFRSVPIFELYRFVDGTEWCPSFKRK